MVALFCVLFCVVSAFACAAESVPPLTPVQQPLAVVRADRAALIADLLQTRQARAFGLGEQDGRDFSGRVQGVDVQLGSARDFLGELVGADARNFWYCLLQDGGTLARRTGAMGWDFAGDGTGAADVETQLTESGVDLRGAVVETSGASDASGATRVVIARDGMTKDELTRGASSQQKDWQTDLTKFLSRRDSMVGVLANSRPLFGLYSVVTGVDVRSRLAEWGLRFPVSVQLELFNNGGDLGVEARLNNLLPEPLRPANAGKQEHLTFHKDPLLEVNFPAPEVFQQYLPFDPAIFALLNIDVSALLPQAVNFTAWRNADGGLAWAVVCLVADRDAFRAQLQRVYEWLEVLDLNDFAPATTLADGEGKSGYFIVSGTAEDLPDPRTIHRQPAALDRVAQYRSILDAAGRRAAAEAFVALARRYGYGADLTVEAVEAALPERDSGYISADGESLVFMSRNGLLPFFVPGFTRF